MRQDEALLVFLDVSEVSSFWGIANISEYVAALETLMFD